MNAAQLFARATVVTRELRDARERSARLVADSRTNVRRARESHARSELMCIEAVLDRRHRHARRAQLFETRDPQPTGTAASLEDRLLRACVLVFGVTTAGLTAVDEGEHRGAMAVSDPSFSEVDDLQFSLGEGPSIDAARDGHRVLVPDLAAAQSRWPAFAPAATARGMRAAFALPVALGPTSAGVVGMYRSTPGDLVPLVRADPHKLTELLLRLLIDLVTDVTPETLPDHLGRVTDRRAVIHQAAGMIAAQLDVALGDALACLRARAWSHGRPIEDVAADVVARRVRFDRDD